MTFKYLSSLLLLFAGTVCSNNELLNHDHSNLLVNRSTLKQFVANKHERIMSEYDFYDGITCPDFIRLFETFFEEYTCICEFDSAGDEYAICAGLIDDGSHNTIIAKLPDQFSDCIHTADLFETETDYCIHMYFEDGEATSCSIEVSGGEVCSRTTCEVDTVNINSYYCARCEPIDETKCFQTYIPVHMESLSLEPTDEIETEEQAFLDVDTVQNRMEALYAGFYLSGFFPSCSTEGTKNGSILFKCDWSATDANGDRTNQGIMYLVSEESSIATYYRGLEFVRIDQGQGEDACSFHYIDRADDAMEEDTIIDICLKEECEICDLEEPGWFFFLGFNLHTCTYQTESEEDPITYNDYCGQSFLVDRDNFLKLSTPPDDPVFAESCSDVQETVETESEVDAFCYCYVSDSAGPTVSCLLWDARLFVVSYATDENNQINGAAIPVGEDVYGFLLYDDDGELEVYAFDLNAEEKLCSGKVVPSTTSTKLVGIDFTDCTSTQILIESIPEAIYKFDPPTTTRRRGLLKDGKSSDDDDNDDLMKTLIDKVKKNSMEPNDMVEKMKATAEHILS
jgi:hypothetical protein